MAKQKKQTFIQGILILMFSQVLVKILGLIYKLYLTNKDQFGDTGNAIYSSGFQIYALLLTVSSVGVPNAVAKVISEKMSIGDEYGAKRILKIAFVIFTIIGFISSLTLLLNAKYIAIYMLNISQAELTLKILSPAIFFVSALSVFRGYFNAKGNMKPTANSQTLEQLVKTIFTIGIVEYIYKYNNTNTTEMMAAGATLATTLATIISFLYVVLYYQKENSYKKINYIYKKEKISKIIRNIFIVAMPITITAILGTINKNIDSFTVVRGLKNFLSEEEATRQYGILSGKIDALITLPMSLNMALSTSLVPTISAAKASNCLQKVENKIKFSILLSILIALPCTVGMIIFANPILKLLFPKASSGTFIFQISAISIFFVLINQTITGILQGVGKQLTPVISLTIGVIIKLICNLVLIPIDTEKFILGGTAGASIGTVMCYMVAMLINVYVLNRTLKFKYSKVEFIIKPLLCTLVMGLSAIYIYKFLINTMQERFCTLFSIVFAIIIYIFMIIVTQITKDIKVSKPLILQRKTN